MIMIIINKIFGGVVMDSVIDNRTITRALNNTVRLGGLVMNLAQGRISTEYIIKDINTNDYEYRACMWLKDISGKTRHGYTSD